MPGGRAKRLGVLITLLTGLHHAEPAQAGKLSLSPGAWSIRYSQRMPPNPSLADSGVVLRFPARYLLQEKARLSRRSLCHHAISQADIRERDARHLFSNRDARRGEI